MDVLRGVAVVAMVLYHFSYDLAYLAGLFDVGFFRDGLGLNLGRAIGGTFIFLAGLSLTLSYGRAASRGAAGGLFRKYLARGLRIFSYGLAITFATWLFAPRETIVFGVLHLIGASIILAYPFLGLKLPNVALGLGCIALGVYLRGSLDLSSPWLAWLGGDPRFPMLDWWPLFPWFGVALLGVAAGNALYGGGAGKEGVPQLPETGLTRPLAFLGRHSLPVYLVHQPVLVAVLVLLEVGDAGLF